MTEPETTDMKVDSTRAKALVSQLQDVQHRISSVASGRSVRLVAVSKLKPANDILALYEDSEVKHRHFGENYAQELRDKAEILPRGVKWHFIGGLQASNCKIIAKVPNLFCVSSVDTEKKASILNKIRGELRVAEGSSPSSSTATSPAAALSTEEAIPPLNIHVQVNTSGEESKSGCQPGPETVQLCRYVETECPHLHLAGLMTIGAIARSKATTEDSGNEDFEMLVEQRDLVAKELGLGEGEGGRELELSMGMSEDFEGAIKMGSGEVRVGSTIFGQRPPKAEAKLTV